MQYIARGQIKTLACYDALPSLNLSQIQKMADWYQKTQKFQRAVMPRRRQPRGQGQRFLQRAGQALRFVPSGAAIDTDVANEPQFTDVPERLGVKKSRVD